MHKEPKKGLFLRNGTQVASQRPRRGRIWVKGNQDKWVLDVVSSEATQGFTSEPEQSCAL